MSSGLLKQFLSFPKIILVILNSNMYQVNTLVFDEHRARKRKFEGRQKIGIELSLSIITGSFNNKNQCMFFMNILLEVLVRWK